MKNLLILLVLICTTSMFSQEEWGNLQKNKLTLKEIGPVWPGCEKGSATSRANCFNKKLATHIAKNFKYPADAYKKNEQGKVIITFDINEKGLPVIKSVKGGTVALQNEAKRNIMTMPKMAKPGMLGGKPRAIQYIVPINFKTGK